MWWIIGIIAVVVIFLIVITAKKKGPAPVEKPNTEEEQPAESPVDNTENKPLV